VVVLWKFYASGTHHAIPTRSPWIEGFFLSGRVARNLYDSSQDPKIGTAKRICPL
jgi:hypothetical protein